ncbi:polynucleotide 5'-hydroxyl-kinase [Aureococcus anophagefferens]|nr:polynucleotide 5'-hydroxyl-kinase [Aureococcus anophagefferens]
MIMLALSCDMHYGRMPFDTHRCPILAAHIKNPIWVVAEAEPVHVSGENVVYDTDGLRSIRRESILSDIDQDWDYAEASLKLERKARRARPRGAPAAARGGDEGRGDARRDEHAAAKETLTKFDPFEPTLARLAPPARILVERVRTRYLAVLREGQYRVGEEQTRPSRTSTSASQRAMTHLWDADAHGDSMDFDDFLRLLLDVDVHLDIAARLFPSSSS